MRFITEPECEAFFTRMGIDPSGLIPGSRTAARFKTFEFSYQSRLPVAREVAEALADVQGEFSTCLLWVHDMVFGDRSRENPAPTDWVNYRRWREATGEARTLHEAPGHLFEVGERAALVIAIEFAIHTGWDALVGAKPARPVIHFSHDDIITIYARAQPSRLIGTLNRLGVKARRRGL